jgi:hypothetical protein
MSAPAGRSRKGRSPCGLRHSLLEHYYLRTKVVRVATASERPSVGLGSRAWQRACAHPQWHSGQYEVLANDELATNQRATRRDRTNVCMCHLDHLLQLPWAHLDACRPPKPRAPNR